MSDGSIGEERLAQLASREVQIWGIWLTGSDASLAHYRSTLASEELQRAERFRLEHLRHSFIRSRGSLRLLLAHYLGRPPNRVELTCRPKGKPILRESSSIDFNASHSGQMALFAFTVGCELGVDVEQLRKLDELESIAARFFSKREASELLSLSPEQRLPAFFRCWTRKEAYVKAIGDGLSIPLDCFQVTLLPGVPARLVQLASDMGIPTDWTLDHLDLAPGYLGALAYRDSRRPTTIHPMVRSDDLPNLLRSK